MTEHALRKQVNAGAFERVYYLHGDDDFRKDEAVAHLVGAAVPVSLRAFNVEARRGAELTAESAASLLETPPLVADRRAVVIRDVGTLRKEARRVLDQYLARPSPEAVVLLTVPAGGKVDRALADHATAVEFPLLTEDRVVKWIAHRARGLDATITGEAAALLSAAVGGDLAQLAGELDKLVSYVRGSVVGPVRPSDDAAEAVVIGESAVSAVVGVRRDETLGALLDRVAARDAAGALTMLPQMLALPKTTAVSVVMALTTQTLALAWGAARRADGAPSSRLANEYFGFLRNAGGGAFTGRPWGEAIAAWVHVVDSWELAALERALDALLAADTALKETRISSDEQVLTSLLLAMCASNPATRGRAA
jgi:DNA polymerase-3 subunit delta